MVLESGAFAHHIERFNAMEDEPIQQLVSNAKAWEWLVANAPLFECPDTQLTETYYFRWWSFRKHIKQTPSGRILTEFLAPVRHAGAFNSISCALGHHLAEARWLRDTALLEEYVTFWFRGNDGKPQPHFHKFSGWTPAALEARGFVTGSHALFTTLLEDMIADYGLWEKERLAPEGLFWQHDVKDGMEESISGSRTVQNLRPTINSYMAASAAALGRAGKRPEFMAKSRELTAKIQALLWDDNAEFFKVRRPDGSLSDAREAIGFIPWQFGLAERKHSIAWKQLTDPQGFAAPFGLTTAERRHPKFRSHGTGTCEWDGALWPFATSQTLTGLASALRRFNNLPIPRRAWFDAFLTYARSHQKDGKPYIGEYQDETTGAWIKGDERSRYYNHSTFADLLITGLVGLVPRTDDKIEVNPLLPQDIWPWFCLDGVGYRGRQLTILWDATGKRYGRGAGLQVLADGKKIGQSNTLRKLVLV